MLVKAVLYDAVTVTAIAAIFRDVQFILELLWPKEEMPEQITVAKEYTISFVLLAVGLLAAFHISELVIARGRHWWATITSPPPPPPPEKTP